MTDVILTLLSSIVKTRAALQIEIVALRHQVSSFGCVLVTWSFQCLALWRYRSKLPLSEGQYASAARIDLRGLAGWQEAAKGRREKSKLITVWRSLTPPDPSPDWRQPNS
jgi:hypothetical protein